MIYLFVWFLGSAGLGMPHAEAAMSASLPGAEQQVRFHHMTVADGLSNSEVHTVLQDRHGFMWFGTRDGLNRFDGYRFIVYKPHVKRPNSLSSNVIRDIVEDAQGNLWIATESGGLNKFDLTTERFTAYLHDPDDPNSLSHNRIQALAQEASGVLWLGTFNGLNRFDPETERFTRYYYHPDDRNSLSHNRILTLQTDPSGIIWIGTHGGGLTRLDPATKRFTRYPPAPDDPAQKELHAVAAIHAEAGVVWVGAHNGDLYQLAPATGVFTRYAPPSFHASPLKLNVSVLYGTPSGQLWVGTREYGVFQLEPITGEWRHYPHHPAIPESLGSNTIEDIFQDQEGNFWFASRKGVDRFHPAQWRFRHYRHIPGQPNGLSANQVTAIHEDRNGALWVGTLEGGLNRWDRLRQRWRHYQPDATDPHSIRSRYVTAICEDGVGNLWIGTRTGLNRWDQKADRFDFHGPVPSADKRSRYDHIFSCHLDTAGLLWLGTRGGGLVQFNPHTQQFRSFQHQRHDEQSLSNNEVVTIYEDSQGWLWLGSKSGLNRFDRQTGTVKRFLSPTARNRLAPAVYAIREDAHGVLWIGTMLGLYQINRSNEVLAHYTMDDGLPSNTIYGILTDARDELWLSTAQGIANFNPQTATFRNYDVSDGLQGNEFIRVSAFQSSSGELFFGGTNGLTIFAPELLQEEIPPPPVLLTQFRLFHEPVDVASESILQQPIWLQALRGDLLALKAKQNVISFEFAALSYAAPHKHRYRYRLDGLDQGWNITDSTRRSATYTSLPPGQYTLRVQGSNHQGVWGERRGVTLPITIMPPWWGTTGVRVVSILFVIGLVSSGYYLRVYSIQRRNRLLSAQVEERTRHLQESETRFRLMVDAAPMLVWLADAEAQWSFVNQSWMALTGRALAQEQGKGWIENLHPDDMASTLAIYHRAYASKQPFELECRLRQASGAYRWLLMKGAPRLLPDGVCVGYVGSCLDITERREAEDQLRRQQEWLSVTLASIGDGVIATDAQGRITLFNQTAEALTGWTMTTAVGHPLETVFRIVDAASGEPVINPVAQALAERRVVQSSTSERLRSRDDAEKAIAASGAPIFDSQGELQGAVLIFRDISEHQRLEAQIRHAQKMQALGTLAGGIAHEFNNMLSAILGFTQLIALHAGSNGDRTSYTDQIQRTVRRATALVQQILTFSRQGTSKRAPLRLPSAVQETLHFLRATLPATITLAQDYQETGLIHADATEIDQIVLNLCANAIYAMRDRGGRLTVRVDTASIASTEALPHPDLSPGAYVRLIVQDTGEGIEAHLLPRIFEPFFTTKGAGEGTGMGLAIVHGIVADAGGAITITSQPGQGTTCTVYLPEFRQDAGISTPIGLGPEGPSRGSARVLFVDDEPALVEVAQTWLRQLGYTVTGATRPDDALALLQKAPNEMDILITDQTMAPLTGLELIRECRRLRPDLPVILCTGFSHAINEEHAVSNGADAFMAKPIDLNALAHQIEQVLTQRGFAAPIEQDLTWLPYTSL